MISGSSDRWKTPLNGEARSRSPDYVLSVQVPRESTPLSPGDSEIVPPFLSSDWESEDRVVRESQKTI